MRKTYLAGILAVMLLLSACGMTEGKAPQVLGPEDIGELAGGSGGNASGENRQESTPAADRTTGDGMAERDNLQTPDTGEETLFSDTQAEDVVFFGSWYMTDYRTGSIYALSQEEIDTFLTYTVAYYEDGFFLNGTPVEAEAEVFGYGYLDYTKAEIEEQFLADLTDWWEGKTTVKGVNLYAEANEESLLIGYCFGANFFAVDSETLWIYYEGVFFEAKRAGA